MQEKERWNKKGKVRERERDIREIDKCMSRKMVREQANFMAVRDSIGLICLILFLSKIQLMREVSIRWSAWLI